MDYNAIKNTLQDLSSLGHQKVLLAHSGGVDSCVLAELLLRENVSFVVAHCNFQLRAEASDADEQFVIKWCQSNEIPYYTKRFDTLVFKEIHKQSTQLAARNLRYQWFEVLRSTHGFTRLLTAHHLNDQFETFLMRTTRGTGINGLLGIPDTDWIQRPLKEIPKSELLAYAKANQINWREDQSNQSDDYLRNEFRHHLVEPWLKAHPDALKNFKKTLSHLTEANLFIQTQLELLKNQFFQNKPYGIEIEVTALDQIPQKAFSIHYWLSPYGFSAKEVLKLLQAEKGKVLLSTSHRVIREQKKKVLSPLKKSRKACSLINLKGDGEELPISLRWESLSSFSMKEWKAHQAALDKKKLKLPLFLRKYEKGDYFYPTGMKGKKLLSKFFRDEKYTTQEKESQWLLCSDKAIVWVIGKRCDQRFTADQKSKEILLMELEG